MFDVDVFSGDGHRARCYGVLLYDDVGIAEAGWWEDEDYGGWWETMVNGRVDGRVNGMVNGRG